MFSERRRRRRTDMRAAHLAEALDRAPGAGPDDDPQTARQVAIARALAPGIHPREQWLSAVKDKTLREAAHPSGLPAADAGTLDGPTAEQHVWRTEDSSLGAVALVDLEPIGEQRAARAVAALARLRARQT